ncbi:porin family protein [uncultured Prevotella sp.]|uniref:type IX secretion/gliding motility protein PorT/SprT n=1 Tax=uncultured Prevotella sp. TaxID=159272 RepID=UPI0025DD4821|nr:porin family protein [uncultured Prevotella sp.]
MKRLITVILLVAIGLTAAAQKRKVQNKPYIDLRPFHFGISMGLNLQDAEMSNVGPQLLEDGTMRTITCDVDNWNPGFSVGVLGDFRLSDNFNVRISPTMHFGSKHLVFRDFNDLNDAGHPRETTQDLKNSYLAIPLDLKFSAPRFNNYRPYVVAGFSPMINLAGKDQDYVRLKRFDAMVNVGLGCDFYLPYFKLIPELKFCYGLTNALDKDHVNELIDVNKRVYANSINGVDGVRTKMFLFTLYFE